MPILPSSQRRLMPRGREVVRDRRPCLKRLPACLVLGLLAGAAPQPARAAFMWTGWEDIFATNETCITVGTEALRQIGFSTRVSGQTVFGWLGDDGLSIRCLADRRIAVFFSYTQDEQNGRNFIEYIRLRLRATAPAPATPGAAAPVLPPIPFGSSGASPGAQAPAPAAPSPPPASQQPQTGNRNPITPVVPVPPVPVPNPPPPRTSPFADPSVLTPGAGPGAVSTTPPPAAPLPSGPLTPVGPTGR